MRNGSRSIQIHHVLKGLKVWKPRKSTCTCQVVWHTLGLQGTVRHCQFCFRVWRCRHFIDPMTGLSCSKQLGKDQPRKTFLSHEMRPRSHSGVGTLTYFPSWREAHSYTYYCTLDDSMPLLPRCEENVKPRSASADTARQAMNSLSFGSMIDTKTWG